MSHAKIVTDSAAELAPEVVQELGITVIPWRIQLGNESTIDHAGLREDDFYKRCVKRRTFPTPLPPTAQQIQGAYQTLAQETDDIVSIHVSSHLGRVMAEANAARGDFLGRCNIQVIDSQFISRAQGILVTKAAQAARGGASGNEIVRMLRGMIEGTYLVFFVETMEYLKKHHLVPPSHPLSTKASAFRPLLMLEEGDVTSLLRSRSRGTPTERLVEFIAEFPALAEVTILRTGIGPDIGELKTRLGELLPEQPVAIHAYGPVLSALIGPNATGIVAFEG